MTVVKRLVKFSQTLITYPDRERMERHQDLEARLGSRFRGADVAPRNREW
ncbi:hypothetical protein GCM10009665_60120 [Kitasatospora nipponensis]|uniref:Uncharacterized protein n=1 Tax=Kitasatospora nipponensis TaxID=258049 RepID=A0ABN1WSS7_9ACTN